jgi:hypothetical protein
MSSITNQCASRSRILDDEDENWLDDNVEETEEEKERV